MKYLNSYLSKQCSADLQPLFCQSRNPAKEISESWGAYENMKPFTDVQSKCIANLIIGDGSLSMTGAIFCFMSNNWSVCIDPLLNKDRVYRWRDHKNVQRFVSLKEKFQDTDKDFFEKLDFNYYNIILIHSHVNVKEVVEKFPNWNYLYTNPCCKRDTQTFSLSTQKERNISVVVSGRDENILSPKNEVIVYQNGNFKYG